MPCILNKEEIENLVIKQDLTGTKVIDVFRTDEKGEILWREELPDFEPYFERHSRLR